MGKPAVLVKLSASLIRTMQLLRAPDVLTCVICVSLCIPVSHAALQHHAVGGGNIWPVLIIGVLVIAELGFGISTSLLYRWPAQVETRILTFAFTQLQQLKLSPGPRL